MPSRRASRRIVVAVVAVLVLAGGAYVAWRAMQVSSSLNDAVDDASRLETAVRAGDQPGMDQALGDLRASSGRAADLTGGPTWGVLTHLPVVGDDARGVRTVSQVAADLSESGLGPLVDSAGRLDQLLPTGGRVDLDTLASLRDPVAQGAQALTIADQDLSAEDPSGFVDRLATPYRALQQRIASARTSLTAADTALQVMPTMLGGSGARQYLLVFQNNAEVRATGGLPGAVSVLRADRGQISLGQQIAAGSLAATPRPVLPLTKAESELYGDVLGTFFLDANMTPDFPRTADLMRARWQQAYPDGGPIDGVLSVDPVALSYLLRATGPVDVGGVSLTSDNVVDELLHEAYVRIPDPAQQDAYFAQVAKAVFDKVTSGTGSPEELLRALAQGADEHRLYVHSFDPTEQDVLDPTEVSGALVVDPSAAPQIGVYLNDGTGAKMSYYLRTTVDVAATSCDRGVQTYAGTATLGSQPPDDIRTQSDYITGGGFFGTPVGSQSTFVRLYGPVGGSVSDVRLDGKKLTVSTVDQDGRPVVTTFLQLDPGASLELTWAMTSGAGQAGATQVGVTPGVEPGNSSSVVASAC